MRVARLCEDLALFYALALTEGSEPVDAVGIKHTYECIGPAGPCKGIELSRNRSISRFFQAEFLEGVQEFSLIQFNREGAPEFPLERAVRPDVLVLVCIRWPRIRTSCDRRVGLSGRGRARRSWP